MINDALFDHKTKYCDAGFDQSKCVRTAMHGDGEFALSRRICGTPHVKTSTAAPAAASMSLSSLLETSGDWF
jgi:hypothetical protein